MTRTKEDVRTSYNKMSKWYDCLAGRAERGCQEAGLRLLGVKEGEAVLEIGFATGSSLIALARAVGRSGRVYGIDIADRMCDCARRRIEEAGISDRVTLICGDAARLPFGRGTMAAVFMSFTLELFAAVEIPVVLGECRRVLRRDGRICLVAMARKAKTNLMTRLYEWLYEVVPRYVDCRPIAVREVLTEAGFGTVQAAEMSIWGLPVEVVLAEVAGPGTGPRSVPGVTGSGGLRSAGGEGE